MIASSRTKIVYGVPCHMPGRCKHGRNDNWYADRRGEWLCGCPEYPGQRVEVRSSCLDSRCALNCPGCGKHHYGLPGGEAHYSDCDRIQPGAIVYQRVIAS